jgi:hypothetical protein
MQAKGRGHHVGLIDRARSATGRSLIV